MKTPRFYALGPFVIILSGTILGSAPALSQTPSQSLSQTNDQEPLTSPREFPPQKSHKGNLTIASWNLEDAVSSGAIPRQKPKRRVWRNTFVPRQKAYGGKIELNETLNRADIVLLQGVHSIREARKLFPARRWKLIISKAILKVSRGRGPFPRIMPEGFATTAIAVRYQLGVRVTGQEHLLEIANTESLPNVSTPQSSIDPAPVSTSLTPSADGNTSAIKETPEKSKPTQAGLAVRILSKGRMIWFVSLALGTSCAQKPKCPSRKVLQNWVEDKQDFDIPVVIAGRLFGKKTAAQKQERSPAKDHSQKSKPDAMADKKATTCTNQDIKLDTKLTGTVKHVAKAGCIAVAVIRE